MIKDSGDRTEFETGAKRDMHAGKGRMDLLPWYGIMEVSKHCEEGALKYGEHNVDKGIPLHSLLDSAARHLAKYMVGMDDEDHLCAACWNLLWALNQRQTHPELDDRFKLADIKFAQEDESGAQKHYDPDDKGGEDIHCDCGVILARVVHRGLKPFYPDMMRITHEKELYLGCPKCGKELMILYPVWKDMGGVIV